MTNKQKTETAAHTPEDVVNLSPDEWRRFPASVEESILRSNRMRLCTNACRGLTAEQVAAIPTNMKLLTGFERELNQVTARLAAFDAMREAGEDAAELLEAFREALTGHGKLEPQSVAVFLGTNKRYTTLARDTAVKLRAALTQADEASK